MATLRLFLLFTLFFLTSTGFALNSKTITDNLPPSISPETKQEPVVIPDIEQLAINQEIKELLDRKISQSGSPVKRLGNLHNLLFSKNGLAIKYNSGATKTAQETFDARKGDCLSLASLFVATARHIGLKSKFQTVTLKKNWLPRQDYYTLGRHVNVLVYLGGVNIEVEFLYTSKVQTKNLKASSDFYKSKAIPDQRALAEYYNNLGAESLDRGEKLTALAYFEKATETYSKVDFLWANLGVLYKLLGKPELAEKAYLKALKINPSSGSTLVNIHALYTEQGKQELAKKYSAKVEKYSRRNPYYLADLAQRDYELNNLEAAIRYYKKAIKLKPTEDSFHLGLALAYFKQKRFDLADKFMRSGQKLALDQNGIDRFQSKIDALLAYQQR
jgi:tetratricopeptide (TPR) repeat protein